MKPIDEIEKRWSLIFNTSIGVDLRQAIQVQNQQNHAIDETSHFDPCEEGLRSVCWKSFLLYGPLSKGSWTKKISESRSAYISLRDHFLRYIDNPNDVHSSVSVDPLTDDDTSPWATLRNDEESREEIMRDVSRCYQDNYFFREPPTQKKLLDILFIYAKLNPDTGYRQGMHELLAPIIWVVSQDALDTKLITESMKEREGVDLMVEVLDQKFIEHDSFNLFCAVMQTAKSFYTLGGEGKDPSAIVLQSEKVHKELLASVEPTLAEHLTTIGLLPQVYCLPWIRLLMGRVFELNELLKLWDALFAERVTHEIVEWTCVAMLLRMYWKLIEADYTTSITTVTKFTPHGSPRSLVGDAIYLQHWNTSDAGAYIVEKYSERRPYRRTNTQFPPTEPVMSSTPPSSRPRRIIWPQYTTTSASSSPTRYPTPQKQLEGIFADVQKRTEGWGVGSVSKALRGAVGEVRRNVNNFQSPHSRETSMDYGTGGVIGVSSPSRLGGKSVQELESGLQALEQRNRALAKMLDSTMESLRTCRPQRDNREDETQGEKNGSDKDDLFNTCLAKIQFVSVYLSDSDIQIPITAETPSESKSPKSVPTKDTIPSKPLTEDRNDIKTQTSQPSEPVEDPTLHIIKHKPRKGGASTKPKPVEEQQKKLDTSQAGKNDDLDKTTTAPTSQDASNESSVGSSAQTSSSPPDQSDTTTITLQTPNNSSSERPAPPTIPTITEPDTKLTSETDKVASTSTNQATKKSHPTRPSLTDSSFSFMLGDDSKRSSFVRSVQHRDSSSILSRELLFGGGAGSNNDTKSSTGNSDAKGTTTSASQQGKKDRRSSSSSTARKVVAGRDKSSRGEMEMEDGGDGEGWSMSSLKGGSDR